MKQKDKIVSSLIIAFVAGFIYYAFADFDVIRKIPKLAFETVKTAFIKDINSDKDILNKDQNNLTNKIKEDNKEEVVPNSFEKTIVYENGVFAHIPNLSHLIRFADISDEEIINRVELNKIAKLDDFGFNTRFTDGSFEFAGFNPEDYNETIDSHKVNVKIKMKNLDTLNLFLDNTMLKLNEKLNKLNEQLLSEEFLRSIPEIDNSDIEIDSEKIKETIKESMKEFDENMKEFHFDMKEFKDSMKLFRENIKDLKENLKNLDSAKLKQFEKKIEIIES